jgi:FkbM family methyltransferase
MKWIAGIRVNIAIHIGGHEGQDHQKYLDLGCTKIIWGEANSSAANTLRNKFPTDLVIEKVFWDKPGKMIKFYHFQNEERDSAIRPVRNHADETTAEMIITTTLDDEFSIETMEKKIILTVDVQGAEIHVLTGGLQTLKRIKYVIVEVANQNQGYEITPSGIQLKELLGLSGFSESINRPAHDGSYSDVLFIKCGKLRIFWISIADLIFSLILKIRHLLLKRHIPTTIYACTKC